MTAAGEEVEVTTSLLQDQAPLRTTAMWRSWARRAAEKPTERGEDAARWGWRGRNAYKF